MAPFRKPPPGFLALAKFSTPMEDFPSSFSRRTAATVARFSSVVFLLTSSGVQGILSLSSYCFKSSWPWAGVIRKLASRERSMSSFISMLLPELSEGFGNVFQGRS